MIPDPFIRDSGGADALVEGFYLIRRDLAERMPVPVRIWFGPPVDEETGDELDRSHRWQIQIAGHLLGEDIFSVGDVWIRELGDFWPRCAANPIDQAEYDYRIARQQWAIAYDENDPFANPGGKIDIMTVTLPFQD